MRVHIPAKYSDLNITTTTTTITTHTATTTPTTTANKVCRHQDVHIGEDEKCEDDVSVLKHNHGA